MPSFALRIAWLMPRICDVIELEIARPAASSLAELMRLPVDRRSIAVGRAWLAIRLPFCARSAAVLELITVMSVPFPLFEAAGVDPGPATECINGFPHGGLYYCFFLW